MKLESDEALARLLGRRDDKRIADAAAQAQAKAEEEARLSEVAATASRLGKMLPFVQETKQHIESLLTRINRELGASGFSSVVDLTSFKLAHRIQVMAVAKAPAKRTYGLHVVVYQDGKIEVATTKKEILSQSALTAIPSEVADIAVARLLEIME